MIMNKKELMQRSAQVTADIHVVYLGMIADYLKDNGGSLDVDFHMQTARYINYEPDDLPNEVVVSRIFLEGDRICLSVSEDSYPSELDYMDEYLTIDEMLALIRYIYSNPKLN